MNTETNFHQFSSNNKDYSKHSHDLPNSYPAKLDDEEEKLDLGWVFAVAFRRFPIMVAVAIILTGLLGSLIVLKSRKVVPEYQGGFTLLIEPVTVEGQFSRKFLSAQAAGADINKTNVNNNLVDYESLIRVLKSPKMMDPIVEKLQVKYPKLTRSSLSGLEMSRIMYEKDGKEEGTKLVKVVYRSPDIEKIQFVLENLANAYLEYSYQERLTSIKQGIDFIDKQLPALKRRFENLQRQLQTFRQEANLINPVNKEAQLSTKLRLMEDRLVTTQAQLAEKKIIAQTLTAQFNSQDYSGILGNNSSSYNQLLRRYQDIESEVAIESARLREDSIPMQSLRQKQQNMKLLLSKEAQQVVTNVTNKVEVLEARANILQETVESINQKMRLLPALANQEAELQQKLKVASDTLTEFLKKREALRIDAAQNEVPWQLISPPNVSSDKFGNPISITTKQTKRQLAIAFILSTLLAIGCGFLVDILITIFHTPDEIKAASKLPILGVIPASKTLKQVAKQRSSYIPFVTVAGLMETEKSPHSQRIGGLRQSRRNFLVSEAFRSLFANICLLSYDRPLDSIVITSPTPGDGKSTVALHLAQTAASIGKRVLLVDANLRNPQIHNRLSLPNLYGLTDAITTDITLNDAIQRSPSEDNLFVLTAGQLSVDPIKVLSSQKRQYLMEQFQSFFDLVIYDTPSLLDFADASIIANQADGAILVVGIKKTDRSLFLKAVEELRFFGASVLGAIANRMK